MVESLAALDPVTARWLEDRFAAPTPVHERSCPAIAAGESVLVVSGRSGARLTLRRPTDHPRLGGSPGSLRVLLDQQSAPRSSIAVEEIDGPPESGSPWADRSARELRVTGSGRGAIRLWRRHREAPE